MYVWSLLLPANSMVTHHIAAAIHYRVSVCRAQLLFLHVYVWGP